MKHKYAELGEQLPVLTPSRNTDTLGGAFYSGDLSTGQPSGGSPGRADAPHFKACDGITSDMHPDEYHALGPSADDGEEHTYWWVHLR